MWERRGLDSKISTGMRQVRRLAGWRFLPLLLAGCAQPMPGPVSADDDCQLRIWFRPERALARPDLTDAMVVPQPLRRAEVESAQVLGSWNGFARPGMPFLDERIGRDGERWQTLSLPLPPGTYDYGILIGDFIVPDDVSPQGSFGPDPRYRDSGPFEVEWTRGIVRDCSAPRLWFERVESGPRELMAEVRYEAGATQQRLTLAGLQATLRRGSEAQPTPSLRLSTQPDGQARVVLSATDLPAGKYTLELATVPSPAAPRLVASASVFVSAPTTPSGTGSTTSPPITAAAPPLADGVVYHVLLDRFLGDEGALPAPSSPGRRAGGTLRGLQRAVEAGYFERLGVTTLWLSPLYQNPRGTFTGRDGHSYEAYHGYWPTEPRQVEPALGGEAALMSLVAAAHARGLRLIFDAVPNHVFADHPAYQVHSRRAVSIASLPTRQADAQSWFHDGDRACICGAPSCGWGERIEDCWFDRYLPDLNLRHPDALQAGVADLLWWLDRFDLDGMRIDAVPMMPRPATRSMVKAVREQRLRAGLDLLVIGENYTGPGAAGRASIRSFLGRRYDGLDSAFDFPLMWAMRAALASGSLGLDALEDEIAASQAAFAGSGAVMGLILDNHDTPRFLSEAAGNAGNDPWLDPPATPTDETPYRRLGLGLTLLYTLPGLPVLYYGDELGLAGANDPDSRRVMPDILQPSLGLSPQQATVLNHAQTLARLRRCLPQLRRGVREPLYRQKDVTVARHRLAATSDADPTEPVLVVLSTAENDQRIFLRPTSSQSPEQLPPGRYRDALSDDRFEVAPPTGEHAASPIGLTVRALRSAIYLPEGHRCF